MVIETHKVKQITRTSPRETVPVRILPPEDLEAGTPITPGMMVLKRTRPDTPTIKGHVTTDHLHDVLSTAPGANTATTRARERHMACHYRHVRHGQRRKRC